MCRHATVHIGLHKTGSTSIQRALRTNAAELRERCGICYPPRQNHSMPIRHILSVEHDGSIDLKSLAHDLEAGLSAGGNIVLSGEGLSNLDKAGVLCFRNWMRKYADDVQVVAYVREPLAWARSRIQQRMKNGRRLAELLARPPQFLVKEALEPWLAVYGRDQITVFDFALASCHPNGIAGHFGEHIGLPDDIVARMGRYHLNSGLSQEAVEALDAMNSVRPERRSREELMALMALHGTPFSLPEPVCRLVEQESRVGVRWLRDRFGLELSNE